MAGNTTYLTPEPTVAVFDPSLLAFSDKLDEISAAEVALQTLRALGPNELESPWSDEVICMAP